MGRDVLRAANFNNGTAQAFSTDVGEWEVTQGRFQVSPSYVGGAATAIFHVGEYIPSYFEVLASIATATKRIVAQVPDPLELLAAGGFVNAHLLARETVGGSSGPIKTRSVSEENQSKPEA